MRARVATLGEALALVRLDGVGSFETASAAVVGIGGAEANVAIGLARLGIDVAWLGRIGDDAFGRRIRRELRAEGVEALAIVDTEASTGLMVKESPRAGRTVVRFYREGSSGSRLASADVAALRVEEATWLHVTGIPFALSATAGRAVDTAMDLAIASGATISFDVNHRSSLWPLSRAEPMYRRIARRAEIVFGGEDELEALVGPRPSKQELARAVATLGPREVIVKCGSRGAGVWRDDSWVWCDAIPVTVVDSVGAGDAFVAGYISVRVAGGDIRSALHRGVRAGAAACESAGDWEGSLRLAELDESPERDPVAR